MEVKATQNVQTSEQKIQLVKGEFSPSQASDLIMSLIKQKINYHKVEGLQLWERNNAADPEPLSNRIKELENEKKIAKKFISRMRAEGRKLKIDGVLNMMIAD